MGKMATSAGQLTLDKFTVNNQIVSMRPVAQRAKAHTINKLTREAKKLTVPKSGLLPLQSEKRILKADRLIEELLLIKKTLNDEVSKHALLSTKSSLDAERSDPSSSLENKALARIASNMALLNSVEQFRSKYSYWKSTLPSLIENLGVKVKKKKNKSIEVIERTRVKNAAGKDDRPTKNIESVKLHTRVAHGEDNTGKMSSTVKIIKTRHGTWTVTDMKECDERDIPKKNTVPAQQKRISIEKKANGKKSVTPRVMKSNSTIKVARFSELSSESSVNHVDDAVKVPEVKTVDSFFVSEDGQTEYMSTVTSKDEEVEQDASAPHKYDKMRETFFKDFGRIPNRQELRSREKQGNIQSSLQSFKNTFTKLKDRDGDKKVKKKVQGSVERKSVTIPVVLPEEGPVHPSWEAKKKQKEMISIGVFQGKKIKFDE